MSAIKWTGNAEFSRCRRYRYWLSRRFTERPDSRCIAFIGLNPSVADEKTNDPTVERCMRRAYALGFDRMMMLNAHPFCSTDPKQLVRDDMTDKQNLSAIRRICNFVADKVVACWGVNIDPAWEAEILAVIQQPVYCLGKTKAGRPRHPLYVPYSQELERFN